MVANAPEKWPNFGEPATKGDVVSALVATRSCIVDIYIALKAFRRGDVDKMDQMIRELDSDDEKLSKLIDRIGGAPRE